MVVQLNFHGFSTESFYDELKVYDGTSSRSSLISSLSGRYIPNNIISIGNRVYLVFTSDGGINYGGFEIEYSWKGNITIL